MIFSRNDYMAAGLHLSTKNATDRATWLSDRANADLVMVNAQTGTVIQYGGTAP